MIDLTGASEVRFGPFLAMTGSRVLTETDSQPVWKVWCDANEKNPRKIAEGLLRDQAILLAQACANEWRRLDKPAIREVGVVAEGPQGPFQLVINGTPSAHLLLA